MKKLQIFAVWKQVELKKSYLFLYLIFFCKSFFIELLEHLPLKQDQELWKIPTFITQTDFCKTRNNYWKLFSSSYKYQNLPIK